MVTFPNCKINLGLHIISKRPDGYHELETVFYPLPFRDVVEVITGNKQPDTGQWMTKTVSGNVTLYHSGLTVQGEVENNLCIKAYRLLQQDFPNIPPIQLYLHKVIPMGAGLGGGSADGVFMLKLLNEKFQLALTTEKLLDYSLQLGSDGPFFIINKPCLATGRGELLQTMDIDLSAYRFVIVNPGIHVSTPWAFSQVTPATPAQPLQEIIQLPVEQWKEKMVNDFEIPVCHQYPELKTIKEELYNYGAVYAAMSGSGSSFFGIFPKGKVPVDLFKATNYLVLPL